MVKNKSLEELIAEGYSFKDIQKMFNDIKKENENKDAKKQEIAAAKQASVDAFNKYLTLVTPEKFAEKNKEVVDLYGDLLDSLVWEDDKIPMPSGKMGTLTGIPLSTLMKFI